ncbi:glycoside hydrolase family 99-like domain-containing protein, partial [Bacillus cereus]|uniref:glycoside hydrolase family 99-like domain-containing protein n=1 Tax=Bacillus cereus TaxID=1396 RepID=UPI003D18CC0A
MSWEGLDKHILMPQYYGDISDWKENFYYLLQYFQDDIYIYIYDKPLFIIYSPGTVYYT